MSVVEPEKIAMNGMDCAEIDKAERLPPIPNKVALQNRNKPCSNQE
jgi:hypothetical protein